MLFVCFIKRMTSSLRHCGYRSGSQFTIYHKGSKVFSEGLPLLAMLERIARKIYEPLSSHLNFTSVGTFENRRTLVLNEKYIYKIYCNLYSCIIGIIIILSHEAEEYKLRNYDKVNTNLSLVVSIPPPPP